MWPAGAPSSNLRGLSGRADALHDVRDESRSPASPRAQGLSQHGSSEVHVVGGGRADAPHDVRDGPLARNAGRLRVSGSRNQEFQKSTWSAAAARMRWMTSATGCSPASPAA